MSVTPTPLEESLIVPAAEQRGWAFPVAGLLASRRRAWVVGMTVLALVGYIDWATGPNISLTFFYLVPLALTTWYAGWLAGLVVSLLAAAIWYVSDLQLPAPPSTLTQCWNALVRFATFASFTYLVGVCKNLLAEIEKLLAARTQALRQELRVRQEAEEAIHRLASQLSAAEDEQRRHIAQEIHDGLGQNLSLLKMLLQKFAKESPERAGATDRLPSVITLLETTIQQTRNMTFELHPGMLENLGLVPTLEQYAAQLGEQMQIRITVTHAGETRKLPVILASFLFRAAKELVSNAAKHGPAHEICIGVRWREDLIRVIVDDDGAGFHAPSALNPNGRHGMGLAWIMERARSFGGQFQLESAPPGGTRAILDLPLPRNNGAEQEF